ncbi:hypothetical protein VY88_03990 [Azospirillum thiophilum]|uniref:Uncharacterized protein n=1 Tax=Azospirillum thiophilum TaxID=528244 RepID=A0AAC8VX65_9PROT|nr:MULTISPECIES: hypothetical protein [Azospirillum]ALG70981.1 hypothetical protein AL072_08710 [Azospirillum thiophilum]KJR65356.1 hypothetical protein VY88_03990 [Azospirillum thiophilum]PWC91885.1 hypothetical protein TSO5_18700 [Azospirillum sp. TSO5]
MTPPDRIPRRWLLRAQFACALALASLGLAWLALRSEGILLPALAVALMGLALAVYFRSWR